MKLENIQYSSVYTEKYIMRMCLFLLLSYGVPMFYILFFHEQDSYRLLITIFIVQLIIKDLLLNNVIGYLVYKFKYASKIHQCRANIDAYQEGAEIDGIQVSEKVKLQVEYNNAMAEHTNYDIIDQKIQMTIQFALVVLFSIVFPYAIILCLISNIFKMLASDRDLDTRRRPIPELTFGIGKNLTTVLGMISNSAIFICLVIVYYNSDSY